MNKCVIYSCAIIYFFVECDAFIIGTQNYWGKENSYSAVAIKAKEVSSFLHRPATLRSFGSVFQRTQIKASNGPAVDESLDISIEILRDVAIAAKAAVEKSTGEGTESGGPGTPSRQ